MTVAMRDPSGKLWDIPDENVERAQNEGGYRIASPEEVHPNGLADEQGPLAGLESAGRTLLRGAEAISGDYTSQAREAAEAQGLPFDAPAEPASRSIFPELSSEEAKARAVANPGWTALGQVAGEAPLALVPGGAAASIGIGALGGGVNAELEDAWQQNRDFSIEGAAINTGVGLAAGGVLHGLGKLGGAVYDYGKGKVMSLLDAAEDGAVKRGARELLEQVGSAPQTLDEAAKAVNSGKAASPAVRDLAENARGYREEIAKEASKDLQTVRDDFETLTKRTLRDGELADAIPNNREAQLSWALSMRQELEATAEGLKTASTNEARSLGKTIRSTLKAMGEEAEPVEWFRKVATLNEEVATTERKLAARAAKEGGVAADDLAQVSEAGAGLRRTAPAGPEAAPTAAAPEPIPRETPTDDLAEYRRLATEGETQLERDMARSIVETRAQKMGAPLPAQIAKEADTVKSVGARLVGGLGDENVWGRAASNELKRFEQWQTRFADSTSAVQRALFQKGSGKADPRKLQGVLKLESGPTRSTLEDWLSTAERVAGHGTNSADATTREAAARLLDASERVRGALAKADLVRLAAGRVGAKAKPESALREYAKDAAVGAGIEYAQDKLLGALPSGVGFAAGVALRRGAKLSKVLGLGELLKQGDRAAVRTMLRPVASAVRVVETGGRVAQRAPPRVAAIAGSSFSQWSKDPERYQAATSRVRELASKPDAMFEHMSASYGDLAQDAPDVYAGLVRQNMRAVSYLAATIPANPRRGLASARAFAPSEDALWEYSFRYDAVTDPDSVRDAVRAGTVKPQQIEALQAVYPKRYEQLKLDVMEELQSADEAGVVVPIAVRSRIALIFGTSNDPAFSDEVAVNITAARREGMANRVAMRPSSATQSPSAKALQSPALAALSGAA